jgi:hypothetical protein
MVPQVLLFGDTAAFVGSCGLQPPLQADIPALYCPVAYPVCHSHLPLFSGMQLAIDAHLDSKCFFDHAAVPVAAVRLLLQLPKSRC